MQKVINKKGLELKKILGRGFLAKLHRKKIKKMKDETH